MSDIPHLPGDTLHAGGDAPAAGAQESSGFSIDYRRLLETAKRYFWVVILYLIAGLSAATVYLINATPIYQSLARLQVEQRVMAPNPTNGMDPSEDLRGLEMLQTIQLGFVSRSLMQRMVERKGLKTRADFTKSTPLEGAVDEEAYVQYLLGNTRCELIQGTRLMTISFNHPDPHVAQEMVDALVQEYILLVREQRLGAASVNLSYLIEERKAREENLRRSEEKLAQYTRELGSVSIDGGDGAGMNIVAAQLVQLNERLGAAKGERAKLQSDSDQISKFRNDPKALLEIASISDLPVVTTLRGQLNGLDADISRTRQKYRTGNPQLMQLESQRASLQKAMEDEALRAPQTVDRTLQAAIQTEAALQNETDLLEKRVIKNKEMAIQSKVLERQISADTETYQAILKKYNEETSQATSQPVYIEVIDSASPAYKVKPNPIQVLAIASFISILLAAGSIFLLANSDTSFKSVDELEAVLGIHVLAAIPLYEVADAARKAARKGSSPAAGPSVVLPLLDDPYSAASEAYRTLRASLLLVEDESHSILVTSAVPEEGKSTTSISLAISMAQRGVRTVLIEADLRKPVIQERLIGSTDHMGVADFLSDHADFDEIIQATEVPNLSVISAGRVNKNSGELLLRRPRVEKLFELARKGFEQVIVDSAPLLAVSDTMTIARHFHVINLVVRSHKTPRRMVVRALDLLKRIRRVPAGVALSMVPPGNAYYYYGYNEGGDRAYGAGHQSQSKAKS